MLLVTRAHVLSPGPWAAERGSAGRWVYRLPESPFVLVSEAGREKRLGLVETETLAASDGAAPGAAKRAAGREGSGRR